MNIFVLDKNPKQAAEWHMDKHIVKMPLETAQILCTILNGYGIITPYKSTHVNHPCTLWTGKSMGNFIWLCELGLHLCDEYSYRYEKQHACKKVIEECLTFACKIPNIEMTEFVQAMPDEIKSNDTVESYKKYYIKFKSHIAKWKKRNVPNWYKEINEGVYEN